MGVQFFVEGGLAAITAGCATHPLDLIKVRMQLHGEATLIRFHHHHPALALASSSSPSFHHRHRLRPPSPLSIASRIIQSEGLSALFSGLSATILRQGVYSTTCLGLYESFKAHIYASHGGSAAPSDHALPLHQKISAGLLSGGIGAAIGNPADVSLVRMQADGRLPFHLRRNYSSVCDALFQIVKKEGVTSLWRGSALTIQRAMVVAASQLVTYDQAKENLLHRCMMRDGVATHVMASCAAGLAAAIASNPIDVMKTRILNMKVEPGRTPPYSSALDCAIKTVKAEGPLALYKGFLPTLMRQGPYAIVMFVTLEQVRKLFQYFS